METMVFIQKGRRFFQRIVRGNNEPNLLYCSVIGNKACYNKVSHMDGIKRTEVQSYFHTNVRSYISSTNIFSASFSLRLRLYPATEIDIGSPSGAICSTFTFSPGIQPISISLIKMSSFSKECMTTVFPILISDSLLM